MKIKIGSTYFVSTVGELTDSLFHTGGTASGLFKPRHGGILFCKPDKTPFAFLVCNGKDSPFFVTCSRQEDGRIRYMFGLCNADKTRLGMDGMSYSQERKAASDAVRQSGMDYPAHLLCA